MIQNQTKRTKINYGFFKLRNALLAHSKNIGKKRMKYAAIGQLLLKRIIPLGVNANKLNKVQLILPKHGRSQIHIESRRHWQPMKWK